MAVFQRSLYGEDPTFANLFRLLDDFGTYSREVQGSQGNNARQVAQRIFSPRFDVRETDTTYELDGELPGIDREHLQIEFTEPQSLTIRGRIERNYTAGTPPSTSATEQDAEAGNKDTVSEEAKGGETKVAEEKGETTKAVTGPKKERYWYQERSIGEFHRTFTFPTRVDESAVKASLNNGVLHVTVAKAAKHETRRINLQ